MNKTDKKQVGQHVERAGNPTSKLGVSKTESVESVKKSDSGGNIEPIYNEVNIYDNVERKNDIINSKRD